MSARVPRHLIGPLAGILGFALALESALAAGEAARVMPMPPIAARHAHQVASPNGTRSDDYYWLRDDARQSPEVLGYLEAENHYRDAYLAPSNALQQTLYDEITHRLKPDDASAPVLEHGFWYYTRYEPGRDYPVYARRKGSMAAPEQVLLDGNVMAQGKAFFQIGSTSVSPDGSRLAYTEDTVGRRQYTLRIKDLRSDQTLADQVADVEPSIEWAADSRTLLYVEKDPVTLLSVRVRKHRLGSGQTPDPLVYEEKDHSYYMSVGKSRSEKYLYIELQSTQQSEVRFADAADPALKFRVVLPREADHLYSIDHLGPDFIVRTNWNAPNFRIMRAPIASATDKRTWSNIVPLRDDAYIEDFEVSKDYLVINERSGGLLQIRIKPWSAGEDAVIASDAPTYAATLVHTPGLNDPDVRYIYSSLATPRTTIDVDLHSHRKQVRKTETVLGGFDASNYVTEFLMAPARDGRSVPVSVVRRKDVPVNGAAPLYLHAYGSYGYSSEPTFVSSWVSLLDRGFVVAIAHVRGGQELGRGWYEDGRLLHKKNTFTDFIDVTDFLVARRYAARDKVFASGGSAGGLLMGAIANMAPEKYRGIIAYVPYVDVVTTMLDDSIPLTSNEYDQWGNPKEKKYYDYMLSYSPYDQVSAQRYPAMLVVTSLWDSQVQYYEPAKWVAKLRATKLGDEPLVLSTSMAGGHGGKSGRFQRYHDTAMEFAFMLQQLGPAR